MSRVFTGKITTEQLAWAIAGAFVNSDESGQGERLEFTPEECDGAEDFLKKNCLRTGRLTPKIVEDLAKVEFDEENLEWEEGTGYCGLGSLTGFHTLPNGLTYLGITAGGDWEVPLFYIVYWDGTKLRGYIPTDGNFWNTSKKSAYGNNQDEGEDDENAKQRFGVESSEELNAMDETKILEDIQSRIAFSDGKFVLPPGKNSIDSETLKSNIKKRKAQEERDWAEATERRNQMQSTRVVIVDAPIDEGINGKNFDEILTSVMESSAEFSKLVGDLKCKKITNETVVEMLQLRDINLRKIVSTYCTLVDLVRTSV